MRKIVIVLVITFIFTLFFCGRYTVTPYTFPDLKYFPPMPVSSANPVTSEGAKLGRYLFYDPILSSDSSISCSSCHKQNYAFCDAPLELSKGRNGTLMKRNTMPLFNLAWYPAFFWDGKAATIEEQIFHPIKAPDEMNMSVKLIQQKLNKNMFYKKRFIEVFGKEEIDSGQIANAIGQFLRTLISYQSKYDKVLNGTAQFTKDEFDGFYLMNIQTKGDCLHCHTTDADALGTTAKFSNNGLDEVNNPKEYKDKGRGAITGNEKDNGKFRIPTLRNIALTAPYMHDGRFKTLEEVVEFYNTGIKNCANIDSKMEYLHQGGAKLNIEEKRKIVSFLKTLTDSTFIFNPEFNNPFATK